MSAKPQPAPRRINLPVLRRAFLPAVRFDLRRVTERVRRMADDRSDQEFLPAHLEILDTPPSPYATVFTWVMCLMFAVALIWSIFAQIDIHAVATARIQPSGRSKVVQPFDTGKVQTIAVENGSRVQAGDVLLTLEPTEAEADLSSRQGDLAALEAQIARRRAMIEAVEKNLPTTTVSFPPDLPAAVRAREEGAMLADLGQYVTTREAFEAQLAEKAATQERFAATSAARVRLQAVLQERAQMRETLVAKSAGTRAAVIDAVQQVEQVAADLAYDRGQLIEAKAAATSLERRISQLTGETLARQYQALTEAAQKRDALVQDVVKATLKRERTQLKAPIAGTVQQFAVTTLGQVVIAGQPLMVVVPTDGPIEVEAQVQNKDIGFILPDQEAVVKIDAFPFTRYGSLEGRVVRVSRDAVDEREAGGGGDALSLARSQGVNPVTGTPKTQNLIFPVTVALSKTFIIADGKHVALTPGMTATVEIRTGRRRVIDYLLSPMRETTSTAGHER